MGDRFYMQQKAYKPGRRVKKDITAEIADLLGREVEGLDKCTIATLDALIEAIKYFEVDVANKAKLDFAVQVATGD